MGREVNFGSENFSQLSSAQKLSVLQTIGRIPCAAAVSQLSPSEGNAVNVESFRCRYCDIGTPTVDPNSAGGYPELDELMQVVLEVTTSLSRNSGLRTVAMLSLRRFLLHGPQRDTCV